MSIFYITTQRQEIREFLSKDFRNPNKCQGTGNYQKALKYAALDPETCTTDQIDEIGDGFSIKMICTECGQGCVVGFSPQFDRTKYPDGVGELAWFDDTPCLICIECIRKIHAEMESKL